MELTPELFEKTEFTERRRGYDIDQVETFLEEAGTALAQMMAKMRHIEERAAHAEARLAETDQRIADADARAVAAEREAAEAAARVQHAERSAHEAAAGAAEASRAGEQAEVEQAAKTLLMAKRTAEATVNEARGQAQSLLEDSQNRAQRQLNEASAEAAELVRAATQQAENEYAERKAAAAAEVEALEGRRSQLGDVITQLEARLGAYREDLGRTAQDLLELADDPERLGGRPTMSLHPDEVLVSDEPRPDTGGSAGAIEESEDDSIDLESAGQDTAEVPQSGNGVSGSVDSSPQAAAVGTDTVGGGGTATATVEEDAYVDLTASGSTAAVDSSERWAPGSWAEVEAELSVDEPRSKDDRPTEAVAPVVGAEGAQRDRFMDELDSAVNEAVPVEDDAMTAFFEDSNGSRSRRFGWRR